GSCSPSRRVGTAHRRCSGRVGTAHQSFSSNLNPVMAMSEYHRNFVPGGTYFFTVVTHGRQPLFSSERNVQALRASLRAVQAERPFTFHAGVVLPDHLHFLWSLPHGDHDYSKRIGRMKVFFTRRTT